MARPQLAKTYEEALRANGVNFIVFPTEPIVSPIVREGGDVAESASGKRDPQALALIRNTCTAAVVGAPGVSIPAGLTAEGLPVGLEYRLTFCEPFYHRLKSPASEHPPLVRAFPDRTAGDEIAL